MFRNFLLACAALALGLCTAAEAATISRIAAGSFGISDGTSNTVQIGENTTISVCVSGAGGTIADGTSNTILFGERGGFVLTGATPLAWVPNIQDGLSNTVFVGELSGGRYCLNGATLGNPVVGRNVTGGTIELGGASTLDICFSNVTRSVNDGSSNTVFVGERFCALNVSLADDAVIAGAAVPLPGGAVLGLSGIGLLAAWRRRRGPRRSG